MRRSPVRLKCRIDVDYKGMVYHGNFDTLDDAEEWIRKRRENIETGNHPPARSDWHAMFITEVRKTMDTVIWKGRPNSEALRYHGKLAADLFPKSHIHALRPHDIDFLIEQCRTDGETSVTINLKLTAMAEMFAYAKERGWADCTPRITFVPADPGP